MTWTFSTVVSVGLICICAVVALVVVARGMRQHNGLHRILDRAQWPLLYAVLALPIGFSGMRTFVIAAIAVLVVRQLWSSFRQRRP